MRVTPDCLVTLVCPDSGAHQGSLGTWDTSDPTAGRGRRATGAAPATLATRASEATEVPMVFLESRDCRYVHHHSIRKGQECFLSTRHDCRACPDCLGFSVPTVLMAARVMMAVMGRTVPLACLALGDL